MDLGSGQQLADERHLGERGAIEMADAASPQRAQNARLGVALDGIENIARKALDKPLCGAGDRCRPQAQQRIARPRPGDDRIDRGESSTPLRAGREKTGLRHRTILRDQEATCRSARRSAGGEMTDQGKSPRRGKSAPRRQTMVRGLRIACRNISFSLKEAGPRVAGSAEKDALRRSGTPRELGF
jgi:hypothetical protein